jgi:DNA-binding transcriptional regulator YiaG
MTFSKAQKYQYVESGLENVFLDNIEIYFCGACEIEIPAIPKILRLHETIGLAIVSKKNLLNGADIRFLRRNLRLKSQDWAKLLRSKKETVSRWENDLQAAGPQSDLLIRYLYLRLLEEKKGMQLGQNIAERLSDFNDDQTAIVIDAENVEKYTYLPLAEVLHLKSSSSDQFGVFDLELDEANLFLGEIEAPLPFEKLNGSLFRPSPANVQELALAA